jgi:hypothetical protein
LTAAAISAFFQFVRNRRKVKQAQSPVISGVCALLAFLVLTLSLASMSPSMHEKLHCGEAHGDCSSLPKDAKSSTDAGAHFCAVNWLAGGVLLVEAISAPNVELLAQVSVITQRIQNVESRHYLYAEARAPPLELI